MKIYLDVCCLNRPFDDQTQDRIRLESEAILAIIDRIYNKDWCFIGSEIIHYEISKIPDQERKERVLLLLNQITINIRLDADIINRSKELIELGFQTIDALHLASAEKGEVDVFLSTDDDLIRKAQKLGGKVNIRVANPLDWLNGVI